MKLLFFITLLFIGLEASSQNIVAQYNFSGNANDDSGNGSDGIVYNALLTEDRSGNLNSAYYFNGSNSYIEIPNYIPFNFGLNDFSVSFWMKSTSQGPREMMFQKGSEFISNAPSFWVRTNDTFNNNNIVFLTGDGNPPSIYAATDTLTIVDGNWHHIVIQRSQTFLELYVDCELVATNLDPYRDVSDDIGVIIGAQHPHPGNSSISGYFEGSLDDFKVYDQALTDLQIQNLCFYIGEDTTVCSGQALTIDAGSGGAMYLWNTGETTQTITVNTAGTYGVTVTDLNANTVTDSLVVTVNALPSVTAGADDDEVCEGEPVTLTGGGAVTYSWDGGVIDGVGFIPSLGTTTYTVIGIDTNGCQNTADIDITVYPALEITYTTSDELFGTDGSIDITVTGGNPAYIFDWDNDGTGDFDDAEDPTGISGGTYTVIVQDAAGCVLTESIEVNSQLSISDPFELKANIYPNPTSFDVTIQLDGNFSYQLISVEGRVIFSGNAIDQTQLSLNNLPKGTYLISITANKKEFSKIIVKT